MALFSMGFSRQEYWSGLPFPSPGDLLDPGIKPTFPALQVNFFFFSCPKIPSSLKIFGKTFLKARLGVGSVTQSVISLCTIL